MRKIKLSNVILLVWLIDDKLTTHQSTPSHIEGFDLNVTQEHTDTGQLCV